MSFFQFVKFVFKSNIFLGLFFFIISCNNENSNIQVGDNIPSHKSLLPDEYIGRYESSDNDGYIDITKNQEDVRFNYVDYSTIGERATGLIKISRYDSEWNRYVIHAFYQDTTEKKATSFSYLLSGDDGYQTNFGHDAFPAITGMNKVYYLKLAYEIENTGILKLYIKK